LPAQSREVRYHAVSVVRSSLLISGSSDLQPHLQLYTSTTRLRSPAN
jgi:hypothetical protein